MHDLLSGCKTHGSQSKRAQNARQLEKTIGISADFSLVGTASGRDCCIFHNSCDNSEIEQTCMCSEDNCVVCTILDSHDVTEGILRLFQSCSDHCYWPLWSLSFLSHKDYMTMEHNRLLWTLTFSTLQLKVIPSNLWSVTYLLSACFLRNWW